MSSQSVTEDIPLPQEATKQKRARQPTVTTRRLLRYLLPFWKVMMLAAFCLLVSSGAGLIFPWLIQHLLDGVFVHHDQGLLNQIALLLIVIFVVRSLFDFGQNYLVSFISERLVANLRKQVFGHLQSLALTFFNTRRTGEIMSRVTTDVVVVQTGLTTNVLTLLQELVMLVGSFAIIVVIDWRLTLLIMLLVPLVVLLATGFGRRFRWLSRNVQEELGIVNTILEETLSAMRVVKSFAREPFETQRFNAGVDEAFRIAMKRTKIRAIFGPFMGLISFVAISIVIWYGGTEVLAGHLSPGQLISFVIYMVLIAGPVVSLSNLYTQTQEALGAAERIFELLDTAPERPDAPDAVPLPSLEGQIVFDHVSFSYNKDAVVLRDLSMAVQAGQMVALVGPSGAGKTTITGLIPRLFEPTSGHIFIDGYDLQDVQIRSLREQIAIVPQEPALFGGTIHENIAYGRLDATREEIEEAASAANAAEFIARLPQGYGSTVGERGVQLSAGQRQRIAIARAILRNPRILILDEATASLDNESEALVQDALNRLMRGRTTLIIAHRLTTIENADHILVLNHGTIVEEGTHEALLIKDGLYARLYNRQFSEEMA
nr:ABC transporter ATP-binding protein [Ktedonobacteraceae bacterium]